MSLLKWSLHLLIIGLVSTSCSFGEKEEMVPVETAEEEQTLDMLDEFEGEDLFAMDENEALDDDLIFGDDQMAQQEQVPVEDQMMEESWDAPVDSSASPQIQESANYTVEEGDTLMFIAHKKYGDYSKWRSIANMNQISNAFERLEKGRTLQLDASMIQNLPELSGRAYVIKQGDTLSKISIQEYGTMDRWKDLWKHNSVMIKDPDLIFAGFQMHLLPDGTVAMNL